MKIVRVVPALSSRPGRVPGGSAQSEHLVVLADDMGRRAVPLWLRVSDAKSLWHVLAGPAADAELAGGLEETAARLLRAAGVEVTAVDIETGSGDVPELCSDTVVARVRLATAGSAQVVVSANYGLALAAAAGAPVRVADDVMDRLAVPVTGEDVLAPFLPPVVGLSGDPGQRRRFEPRNMAFTEGLDRWELAGSFLAGGRAHWLDYSRAAADGSAVLAAAVPEPSGSAVLAQTIYADDYRGAVVTFRGQVRTTGAAGHAGLYLAAGRPDEPAGSRLGDGGGSLPAPGSSDWTWHEIATDVPGDAGVIRFGIFLTGPGRVELRSAELIRARPGCREQS
jgi:bifunctional DNase/RNase